MPRFKWNDAHRGKVLNRYIDMICRDFPSLAKDIVKNGIGPLGSWLEDKNNDDDQASIKNATCGCLVGTTCLMGVKRYSKTLDKVMPDYQYSSDPSRVLYNLIVAKTKRDITKYDNDVRFHDDADPLLRFIGEAGSFAADEAEPGDEYYVENAEGYKELPGGAYAQRERQVIDHFENRIRKNLNIPYPKRKHAQA